MAVLVDTNIIIDVLSDDPRWAEWSIDQLETLSESGLMINPIIYTELCYGCPSKAFADQIIKHFQLTYQEIPRKGLYLAAKAFEAYKTRQGLKTSVLPDFIIGGHAEAADLTVLTRDTKRLKSYFPNVELISP